MYHLVDNLQTKAGDALVGYFVKLKDGDGNYATLYSDVNGTPIINASGLADAAKSDAQGMYDLYVEDGVYDIEVFDKDESSLLVSRVPAVQMLSSAVLDDYPTSAELAASTGASLIGRLATGTGATARTAAQVMDEFVFATDFTGYDPTGHPSSDSAAAIVTADAAARSRLRTLILPGSPRLKTQIVLAGPTRWRGDGHMKPGFPSPGALIFKDASMTDTAIVIPPAAYNTIFEGINLLCDAGNAGDGIHITGDRVTLQTCAVRGAGQDGIRLGSKVAGPYNADGTHMIACQSGYNGRDGLHLDDLSGIVNANACIFAGCSFPNNGRHGVYLDHALYGNTFTGCLYEGNTGYGIYLDTNAKYNVFTGGDCEGNVAGDVFEAVERANRFVELTVNGYMWNNMARVGVWTPTVKGSTSAGTGTYTTQIGRYSLNGGMVKFWGRITWTAHTGTGSLYAALPLPVSGAWSSAGSMPADMGLLSGSSTVGFFNYGDNTLRIFASPGLSNTALPASGTLYIAGAYEYLPGLPAL